MLSKDVRKLVERAKAIAEEFRAAYEEIDEARTAEWM